jgi:hypothetical protein
VEKVSEGSAKTAFAPDTPTPGVVEALGEDASFPAEPRTVGGAVWSLNHAWTVADDEMRVKAAMEQWVRAGACRAAYDAQMRGDLGSAEALRSVYNADFGAGRYNWGGKYIAEAIQSGTGMLHFFYLLLLRCHPNITAKVAAAIWKGNPDGSIAAVEWALGNLPSLSIVSREGVTQDEIEAAFNQTPMRNHRSMRAS